MIIDFNLRWPALHKMFGLRNTYGVVNVLYGEGELSEVCQKPLPRLTVATNGRLPHNPTELLSSARFAELIDRARAVFDYVLIDTPPVGAASDAVVLATQADTASCWSWTYRTPVRGPSVRAYRAWRPSGPTSSVR